MKVQNKYWLKHIGLWMVLFSLLLTPALSNIQYPTSLPDRQASNTRQDIMPDSLVEENTGENYIFQSIEYMTEEKIIALIDSLLDEETIPLDLIHEINLYVKSQYEEHDEATPMATHETSVYPAHQIYLNWDIYNTHPYPNSLSKDDTTVLLVLQDSTRLYVPPMIGKITSNFGDGRNHSGLDIDLEVWDTVVSAFDGMVRIARRHGGYGRVVVVRHYNGLETLYAHLHRIKVVSGDIVKAGQLVGLGGSSGNSTGSHLHFECRFKGKPLNPRHFLDIKNEKLIRDTVILKRTRWSYTVYPRGVKYHIVESGDFLYKIAERYGTTIRRLCELNGISRNGILRVGQKLRIG